MLAPTNISPSSLPLYTATTAHDLLLSGNPNRRHRPRHMTGLVLQVQARLGDGGGGKFLPSRRHAVIGIAKAFFSLINEPCLRYMNKAAQGRSYTGTFCGDFLVGAMANSWRLLVQGLTSLMFLCAHADEYVRPPPSPLVLMAHDKPASHPQQVHISTVGTNNMRISWVTDDRSAPSVVEYGTSPGNYTTSATGDHTTYHYFFYKSGAIHHVTMGPLEPSTTYYYRCGKAGDEFSLRTPPATLPIEFVVIGASPCPAARSVPAATTAFPAPVTNAETDFDAAGRVEEEGPFQDQDQFLDPFQEEESSPAYEDEFIEGA